MFSNSSRYLLERYKFTDSSFNFFNSVCNNMDVRLMTMDLKAIGDTYKVLNKCKHLNVGKHKKTLTKELLLAC